MRNVMSPGHLVFPVLRLQCDAVSGSSSLSDPDFELHSLLTHALSQTHLTRLQGGGERERMETLTSRDGLDNSWKTMEGNEN